MIVLLLLVAPLTGPFQLCRTIGIKVTGIDAAARPPVGLILGHNLASNLGHATDGSAPGLVITIGGYRRWRCPPAALTLAP